jgi:HEPN domain-containing protein
MAFDRTSLQSLAELRLHEARVLLDGGHPSGAYYLSGYAIELALKAMIAKGFRAEEIPSRSLVDKVHTHDLSALLRLAGLEEELKSDVGPGIERWTLVAKWSEAVRYEIWTVEAAAAMLEAIEGDQGVFRWLIDRW